MKHEEVIEIYFAVKRGGVTSYETDSLIKEFSFDQLIGLLYDNYEVELIPEERLFKLYNDCCEYREVTIHNEYDSGVIDGIETTLAILGLKIKGINE